MSRIRLLVLVLTIGLCQNCKQVEEGGNINPHTNFQSTNSEPKGALTLAEANRLAQLPLECIQNPLPYKSGIVIAKKEDLAMPIVHQSLVTGVSHKNIS